MLSTCMRLRQLFPGRWPKKEARAGTGGSAFRIAHGDHGVVLADLGDFVSIDELNDPGSVPLLDVGLEFGKEVAARQKVERAAEKTAAKVASARKSDWRTWIALLSALVALAGFVYLVTH